MEVIHKNIIIADDVKYYDNLFQRTRGLRFSKKLKAGQAVILAAKHESQIESTIDMFFVFFPIDIIWLDKDKKVVDIRKNVLPFTPIIIPKAAAQYVIELPKGMGRKIQIGDAITFGIETN